MANITIYTPEQPTPPAEVTDPMVYIYPGWLPANSPLWQYQPDIIFDGGRVESAGHGESVAEFIYDYGNTFNPETDTDFKIRYPLNLSGYWVKVTFLNGTIERLAWLGKIEAETRDVQGFKNYGATPVETGMQRFTAYDPRRILDKRSVDSSYWNINSTPTRIGWIPIMNSRDKFNQLVGNRSLNRVGGTYLYGGNSIWTNFDYLQYVLRYFSSTSPGYSLGGQAWILTQIQDTIDFGDSATLGEILQRLIPVDLGIDYTLENGAYGFTIKIYALSNIPYTFGNAVVPVNPDTVTIQTGKTVNSITNVQIVKSDVRRYDSIKIIGKRAVICGSIPTEKGWSDALETQLRTVNEGSSTKNDQARKKDLFDEVYSSFRAPSDWTMSKQPVVRRTLPWIPLREGWDYKDGGEVKVNDSGAELGYRSLSAWVYDYTKAELDNEDLGWTPAQKANFNVYSLDNEWGFRLEGSPPQKLAKNHWQGATASNWDPDNPPGERKAYDYDDVIGTIAFESDDRLELEYRITILSSSGSTIITNYETQLTVEMPQAEVWYLAPNTIVGTADDGSLELSGTDWRILRNDTPRMNSKMAGLLSRFAMVQNRGIITIDHLVPLGYLIGRILTVVAGQYDTQAIQAPITSVSYEDGRTIIRTGFMDSTSASTAEINSPRWLRVAKSRIVEQGGNAGYAANK